MGLTVLSMCPKTGRAQAQKVCAGVAMAAGSDTKVAINGFGRIGRNVLRCWLKRESKPFEIVAINVGSMGAKVAAHLLKYDTVLGTLQMDVSFDDDTITVGDKKFAAVTRRRCRGTSSVSRSSSSPPAPSTRLMAAAST